MRLVLGNFFDLALKDGHAVLVGSGKDERVTYVAAKHSERWSDPEEKVRAEFWAELIYRYQYEPQRIGVEITVPDRIPRDAADIVVFEDDERKRPFAVIECKKSGVTDSEFLQAVEQAAGNGTWAKLRASYVGVVAGLTRRFLDFSSDYGALERESNIIADLPSRYGKPEVFKYKRDGVLDIQPVTKDELILAIKKSHHTLWGGGKLSPPAAFGELCKIIFVKISDELAKRKKGEPYQFQIKTHETSDRLAERIRALYAIEQRRDPNVFTETIKVDNAALRTIVSHLEAINLSETDLDTKGLAFEQFMDSFFKGDFGQYFTPRELVQFAVELIAPTSDDLVLDPACGSGGFLLYALDAVRREASEYHEADSTAHYKHWHDFAEKNLFGIEINDELARVSKMNMIIHDDGHSNIVGEDSLDNIDRVTALNKGFKKDRFDVILTNPPFGASVTLTDRPYLGDFELGRKKAAQKDKEDKPRKGQKTEILFLERIRDYLKPGTGRAAIVVPDGILSNATLQYVRDFLLREFQVFAVISFPTTAFAHYGAAVKSSLLVVRRRSNKEVPSENEPTFMAAASLIGYDATGRATVNELPEIARKYREFISAPASYTP